ncbi:MAG: TonB-dependent receptor plug domain-containing protein, partial [Kordiimonadaceae bacterium]|nr:TonB-dependent receptor plug domain-containing protein [Kordiimonadaceae bacterium]
MTSRPDKFSINTLALKLSCSTIALFLAATQAHAQSIDYSSFEDMFGEPITVGATGTPKRASEVPVNMTIITAHQIRRSGSRDVPEILRTLVGLDVQRVTQTNANVAIRGMNIDGGRLRVLINGRDTFRTYEGVTQWATLPVSMAEIRQIEVVRGPSTSLYGANAVTGVVNIITFNPLNE